jgi:cyanophycin synthetase
MSRPPREPDFESGFSSPTIVDSRRLMGPNLMHSGLGAVLDVSLDDTTPERNARLLTAWHARASVLADALLWPDVKTTQRVYAGGASVFVQAPIDQLMTATELCESAWVFAEAIEAGSAVSDKGEALASLTAFAHTEARSVLRDIWSEAVTRGLNVTFDDTSLAVGTGEGCVVWAKSVLPAVADIDWVALRDIPIVLVTGSNGKTTVVRMVAAMARAAGHTVGYTCTDGVWIGDVQVESGDYSGPAGARRVLQDTTVTFAVLETARGGILRRGLAVQHASVAAIVTLSADHFGGYGITDLASLAEAKLVVAHAVSEAGTLVYNGAIPELSRALESYSGRVVSVRVGSSNSVHAESRNRGEEQEGTGVVAVPISSGPSPRLRASARELLTAKAGKTLENLAEIPATLNGTATHNVLNAAIALTIATELQLGPNATEALKTFGNDPRDNMGRLMVHTFGGITVVVDYAHNPQSVAALIDATRNISATRRAITLGTGGDRDDVALQDIANAAFDSGIINFYIAKEMPKFLRGRAPGAIADILIAALQTRGVANAHLTTASDDITAVRTALQWSRQGDLLLLAIHDQRDEILSLLNHLASSNWHPTTPLR